MAKKKSETKPKRSLRPRIPKYFRESWAELKKVTWPSRREAWQLTVAVFVFSLAFTIIAVVADQVFQVLAERLFL